MTKTGDLGEPTSPDGKNVLIPPSRGYWREWLASNTDRHEGLWVVYRKKSSDLDGPLYDDLVEEALCFGWIDSTVRSLDDGRFARLFTPRKPQSIWSAVNKRRLAHLIASGRMTERGLRVIEVAKANGSWEQLDSVERAEVPDDLAEAVEAAGAREAWDSFPAGARKQMLWQVVSAKRPDTRQRRMDKIVTEAQAGRRASG